MSNVYPSRRIGELLKRDVYSLWLAGMMCPDFRTIIESINWGKRYTASGYQQMFSVYRA